MKNFRLAAAALALLTMVAACDDDHDRALPADIRQVFDQPRYSQAEWSLRVVDLDTGELLLEQDRGQPVLIASVRKLFSVGLALDALGEDHRFTTPVHRLGSVTGGVLNGHLVLVASGDMAMGGRTNPDGSYAQSNSDHNEANGLGNAVLTAPDPLAGYDTLARAIAAAGITRVEGNVVVDERLFEPFDFREQFRLSSIFVNDDVVDVTIAESGAVDWRPKSAAFAVRDDVTRGAAGSAMTIELDPELPECIGTAGCTGRVFGSLPADFVPPFTGAYPLVRTFRITEPANYARTVLIEALARAGVTVAAAAVGPNPTELLPAGRDYPAETRVAQLVSQPYKDHATHVLKASYNIGAELALMHYGLSRGERTQAGALAAEREALTGRFGIPAEQMVFIDGSGGGDSKATPAAVITMLRAMRGSPNFQTYFDAQPRLGIDGSLGFVTDFEADSGLAGAKGQVYAKTGTYVADGDHAAQALAGYIVAKSGRRLAFALFANHIGLITSVSDVLPVFQDEGKVAAMLWRAF